MNSRWLTYSFALLGLMLLYACKGGGDGDVGGTFLEVLQTSPENGTTDTQVATRVGFQIDAPIDPTTLTNETFVVTDPDGTQVVGALAIGDEPNIAVLTPDESLAVITRFTATITTGLRSTSGVTLEEDFEWRFTTLDSAWGAAESVEEIATGTSSGQEIAIDGQNNALAVWEYTEPTGTTVWANRYTRADLWGEPEVIDTGDGVATAPQVAVDGAGNGFAVWQENFGSGTARIWTSRYVVDEGWGAPEVLQNGEVTTAQNPAIAADPAGNAIAIWVQADMATGLPVVWSNRYVSGSAWGAAERIDDPLVEIPPTLLATTAVDMDADGNAIAMWTLFGGVIWTNRYTVGSEWGTAELIMADGGAVGARLDVGSTGDAFAIWVQEDEGAMRQDIWGIRFTDSNWGTPERIDDFDDGDTVEPDIAVDGMGIAHAVWSQSDPDFRNIWANQYTPGTGWGASELIEPPNDDPLEDDDATVPRAAVNTAGNAFVVWRQTFQDWGSIWSNRLDPGTGWMTAELIEDDGRAAKTPKVAVDDDRHAHALWLHAFSTSSEWVRTNRFE